MVNRFVTILLAVTIFACSYGRSVDAATPRIAIIMCEDSYDWDWQSAQASSQGLVGLAVLAGVPYDTLLLDNLLATSNPPYTSIWFSDCMILSAPRHAALVTYLNNYVGAGGNVFLDGPLGAYSPAMSYRGMDAFHGILQVAYDGYRSVANYQVTVSDALHVVSTRMGVSSGEKLSQGLRYGTDIVRLANPGTGNVLLELTYPGLSDRYPYLVATQTAGGGRVVAVSSYGSYVGAATSFRNGVPAGFFDNRVLPYLLHALDWLEHGSAGPIIALQLSHAPMTAVGRLDGDWSGEVQPEQETLDYVCEIGLATGLSTAYGITSSFVASQADWNLYKPKAEDLELLGGAMGSHSHTHNPDMSLNLTGAQWQAEVGSSINAVRASLTMGTPKTKVFINPGNTIAAGDYWRFFEDVDLYMTHGFETSVPYASGVMSFGLPAGVEPVAVVNNVAAPDYQWLYHSSWVYSVEEAADNQAKILDYYQHTVGRGVLYNQMWHDYSIGGNSAPLHFPETPSVRPLFDVNRYHFERNPVYMPSIAELVAKFHIASKALHSSSQYGNEVTVLIDYSAVPAKYRDFVAGMGLRVGGTIAGVEIDGAAHAAFGRDTVMLPQPSGLIQQVVITLGASPSYPRLRFLSKPVTSVTRNGDELTFSWAPSGLHHKACVDGPTELVMLHADRYERAGESSMCGQVLAGSTTTTLATAVVSVPGQGFLIDRSDRPIEAASADGWTVTLALADGPAGTLRLRTAGRPLQVTINGADTAADYAPAGWDLPIPAGEAIVVVRLARRWIPHNHDGLRELTVTCAGRCRHPGDDLPGPPSGGSSGQNGKDDKDRWDLAGGTCQSGAPASKGTLALVLILLWLALRRSGRASAS